MPLGHRLFYALHAPLPEQRAIARHRDGLAELDSPIPDLRLHVTVAITEDYERFPADIAERLCEIGAAIAAEPFEIALDRLSGSAKSIALRVGRMPRGLRALHAALASPMARAGLLRTGWTFAPHVTLGYRKGSPFGRRIEPIRWESQDFVLIHSLLGQSRHERLGSWPLFVRQGRLL